MSLMLKGREIIFDDKLQRHQSYTVIRCAIIPTEFMASMSQVVNKVGLGVEKDLVWKKGENKTLKRDAALHQYLLANDCDHKRNRVTDPFKQKAISSILIR